MALRASKTTAFFSMNGEVLYLNFSVTKIYQAVLKILKINQIKGKYFLRTAAQTAISSQLVQNGRNN